MDYSSQDSNPLDFSRNNKELMHQHLMAHGLMPLPEEDRRSNASAVVSVSYLFLDFGKHMKYSFF